MTIKLAELPWLKNALEPHISEETINFHYGKHHNAYFTKLSVAIPETRYADMSLEDIIRNSSDGIYNNAAQVWNHSFYWKCLAPNGGGVPTGAIKKAIDSKWGSFDIFKAEFTNAAISNFGSGWTWLIRNTNSELEIISTDDAGCPLSSNQIPVLTIDVWEHAYYIDYRNARPDYISSFWNLVNWDFASSNL